MNAMDTAIYWIEYVIRNGPSVLRSPALDLKWWELAQLDIYVFIVVSIVVGLTAQYYIVKLFMKKLLYRFQMKLKIS